MGTATLVVMAAGIGSRFGGGIKQLEPVGPNGELIIDYSVYDAMEAGFEKVVFVIRKDLEKDFKKIIGNRIAQKIKVEYAFQEKEDIPEPYKTKYADRKKPWGTGQAILCCKDIIKEPFLVINADDYYGKEAYVKAYEYLTQKKDNEQDNGKVQLCMIGFVLENTLSENGGVTRGICKVNQEQMLTEIIETKNIVKTQSGAAIRNVDGDIAVSPSSPVSMNMWGLGPEFFEILSEGFEEFLRKNEETYQTKEYLLPTIVGQLLKEGKAEVKVLQSNDKWFGVTYREDKDAVVASVRALVDAGMYL